MTTCACDSDDAESGPVEIVAVIDDVDDFYPACGNVTLEHDGTTWYTLVHVGWEPADPALQDRVDAVVATERDEAPTASSPAHGFAQVAPPGPGDDIGTLVIWKDGVARWTSDSGVQDV